LIGSIPESGELKKAHMTDDTQDHHRHRSTHRAWAHLRFSVVGPLLSAPSPRGQLRSAIEALAEKSWRHPVSGAWVRFSFATIERWYYTAKAAERDPVGVLRRRVRKDVGRSIALSDALAQKLLAQYKAHRAWSYKLHADNLSALVEEDRSLGKKPSYSTVRRFMKARGLLKCRRYRNAERAGAERAEAHFDTREVRSFETPYVGGLWHLDFHHARRKILTHDGQWSPAIALAIHDDHSRLCCHLQWYLAEQAEDLVHGLCQAFEKRGLPRRVLMDNGSAMVAQEVVEGFARLSILQDFTLPYSPFQNGKEEVFWAQLEGRLMAMLEGVKELSLAFLNEASQAWVELEYNRRENEETGEKPILRFVNGPSVLRDCPPSDVLRNAFRMEQERVQRRSDGTVMIAGRRFEVPARLRHVDRLTIHSARWDLSRVHVVDRRTGALLSALYPLDREANSDGRRRVIDPGAFTTALELPEVAAEPALPPLLRKLLAEYSSTGLPPAYIPKALKDPPLNDPPLNDPKEQKGPTL
jgi:transposase InsO family protein